MKNLKLAINGGTPIREKSFLSSCYCSGNEKELLLDCLNSNNWSSFKGATEGWDIKDIGYMDSIKANEYPPLGMRFLGGKYIRELEYLYSKEYNIKYSISSNSATSCLVMALASLNIGPGDEVIVPSMSFNATATAILFTNSIPVFAEIKEDTFCLDPNDVESKITTRTKAILVVHLGGNACNMDSIMEIAKRNNLKVIEDCAQAPHVTYKNKYVGTIGDAGVFSLTETKNITCGEGGVLITNNPEIAFKSRLIRNHGEGVVKEDWADEMLANIIGMNFRLTELQAAVAIPQFLSLIDRNAKRKENTNYLLEKLKKYPQIIAPVIEEGTDYVCFMLKLKYRPSSDMPDRDFLIKALKAEGIPVAGGYGRLMYENPIFTKKIAYGLKGCPYSCSFYNGEVKYGQGTCPKSEEINKQFLWFKFINPPNTLKDMDDVFNAFEKVLG